MVTMKDSGIEWIGEIPSAWKIPKLLYVLREKICDGPHETPSYYEEGIPFISIDSLNESKHVSLSTCKRFISQEDYERFCIKTKIEEGDVLFSKAATIGKTAIVGKETFMVWSPLAVIKANHMLFNNMYLYWILNCSNMISYIALNGSMNTQINVGMRELEQSKVPMPSLFEQQSIANYLDSQCGLIDSVIEKTKTSIEEYKKLKQAVITQAVTKGVRGDRSMKDSGIEWIGEIPEEWSKLKLKYCTYIRARLGWKGLKAEEYVEEGYPLLSAFNIINDKLDFSSVNYINQFRYDESPEIKLQLDDIILVKDGAGIGKCAILEVLPLPCTPNGSLAVITVEKYLWPKFLYYYFLSKMFQKYIDRIKDGMGVPHLFQADLREIEIVYGLKEEQQEIVSYLDTKCTEIDNLINKKTALLAELESYKKSLIYEYVTGKKEVPERYKEVTQ